MLRSRIARSEAVSVKIAHIESARMLLRVEHGKGGKDRYTTLSPALLETLRTYFRIVRPAGEWRFPSWRPDRHISAGLLQRACQDGWRQAGLTKRITPHSLRHAFASYRKRFARFRGAGRPENEERLIAAELSKPCGELNRRMRPVL